MKPSEPADEKRCAKCGALKPRASGFYRYPPHLKDRGDADGYRSRCKACMLADTAAYRKANAKQLSAYMRAYRRERKKEKEVEP